MFIEVANFLNAPSLTFFTYYSLGRGRITADLISKDKEFSLNPNKKHLVFSELETSIPMYLVKNIMEDNKLTAETTMIEITIEAVTPIKMTMEFTSYMRELYRLRMDEMELTYLEQGQEVWYEFIPERDFTLKLYRHKGFPFFKIIQCKEDDYIECLSKERNYVQAQKEQQLQVEQAVKQQGTTNEVTGG